MARVFLLGDGAEIARRRRLLPPGRLVEAWPDLYTAGAFWVGEPSKAALDSTADPLVPRAVLPAAAIAIYRGPHLRDEASLPPAESLAARVASAHGIAVAWITLDQFGDRVQPEPSGPADPVFYLRSPGGASAHVWRLFRTPREARAYMAEHYAPDAAAREWAASLSVETFESLLERHAERPPGQGRSESG